MHALLLIDALLPLARAAVTPALLFGPCTEAYDAASRTGMPSVLHDLIDCIFLARVSPCWPGMTDAYLPFWLCVTGFGSNICCTLMLLGKA